MKKIISLLLALMLTFSLSTVCFAAGTIENHKYELVETTKNTIDSLIKTNSKETTSREILYSNNGTISSSVSGSFSVPEAYENSNISFAWSAVPQDGDNYDSTFKLEINNMSYYLPTDGEGTLYNLGVLGKGTHYFRITPYSNCSGNYIYALRFVTD